MKHNYDIELLGFPETEDEPAIAALAKTFAIEERQARKMVERAPCRVKTGASPKDTQRYVRALLKIGADVWVGNGPYHKTYRARDRRRRKERERLRGQFSPQATTKGLPTSGGYRQIENSSMGLDTGPGLASLPGPPPEPISTDERAPISRPVTRPATGPRIGRRTGSSRARVPFGLSAADDDGLFTAATPVFSPGQLLLMPQLAAAGAMAGARGGSAPFEINAGPLPAESQSSGAAPRFWRSIPGAFVAPLRGAGVQWMLLFLILGAVLVSIAHVAAIMFGIVKILVLGGLMVIFAGFTALQARFFGTCMAVAIGQLASPEKVGDLDDFKARYAMPGYFLLLGSIFLCAPMLIAGTRIPGLDPFDFKALLAHPTTLPFVLLPFLYWPMGLAKMAQSGSALEFADVPGVLRGWLHGRIEYLVIVLIGIVTFAGYVASVFLLGGSLLVSELVAFVLLPYACGVQGYLVGRLAAVRPRVLGV